MNKIVIKTIWEDLLNDFETQLEIEKRKYPLTEREQMLADVITKILKKLDYCAK